MFDITCDLCHLGGHDNGYHPALAELQSDGLLEKIVLLQGYEQVATEIRSLRLPMLQIDNLFRSDKVPTRTMGNKRVTPPPSVMESPKLSYTSVVENPRPGAVKPVPSGSPTNDRRGRFINPNLVCVYLYVWEWNTYMC